jgi:hypothetical protein
VGSAAAPPRGAPPIAVAAGKIDGEGLVDAGAPAAFM